MIDSIKKYVQNAIAVRSELNPEFKPSEYWTDFARNFRYVYDLPEEEMNRIRYHTYHLTSDSYLTYYFAGDTFKNLLELGYCYFMDRNHFSPLEEGESGIGVTTEYGRISHDLLRYIGVTSDLFEAGLLDRNKPKSVVEIGGGYGGLARAQLTQNQNIAYFICDLEETMFFSAVYLSKHFGANKVHLVEKTLKSTEIELGHIYIAPQSKIEYFNELQFDYAISQQSLQEMTQKQVERYLDWISKHAVYLYSCNICDHGLLANSKRLVLDLPSTISKYFSSPIWQGLDPLENERFGDNHLLRSVYQCR